MNDKIRKLAEQAGIKRVDLHYTEEQPPYTIVSYRGSPDNSDPLAKFAELIVRECIKQVEPTQHHQVWAQSYLGGVDGLDLLYSKVKEIKQHFGVEP